MKNTLNLLVLVILFLACSPRVACPDISSTYESTRKEKPLLARTKKVQQQTESVALASVESSAVSTPRPEWQIAATKKQLEWIEIEQKLNQERHAASRQDSVAIPVVPSDTTIAPWGEENFEEIKSAQKRGRTSLLLALLFPVVLFIPFVNLISVPLAIGGVVLGTMSLKTFKKYNLKGVRGRSAAILGTVLSWTWIVLSIAAVLVVLWFLLAFGLQ
jgi:hypothetical protein